MKRLIITIGMVIGIGVLSSLTWAGVTHAADVRSGDAPSVSKGETINGSVYIAGRSVTIDGTVKGDVFCAGMNVFISGRVEGDVICAGQTVRVTGTVLGDVRVAGQQVDMGATVEGSATIGGQSVAFLPDAKIGRDLTLWGESIHLNGHIGRDVLGGGQQVIIAATVGRNVQLESEDVALDAAAKIGGDLSYRSPGQAKIDQGATISGKTSHQTTPPRQRYDGPAVAFWSAVYGFCSLLLIGLAALVISPRWFDSLGAAVRTRPLASFGYGAAMLIGAPIVAILLIATLIGLPLGFMTLLLWIAAMIASMAITAYAIGWIAVEKLAWPNRGRRLASLVVGLLILALLGLIPVIGAIVRLLALVFGLGAIAAALITRLRPQAQRVTKGKKA
jgi:cytoskeletal protein CcmA (bactofilin family)